MEEQWKDISGYEGLYAVSNLGRVKSLDRVSDRVRNGKVIAFKVRGRILKQTKATEYPMVTLCKGNKDNYKQPVNVHSLVAKMFIDNPKELPIVNHKDLDKFNNHIDNLEWTTFKGNIQHAVDNGKQVGVKGAGHYLTKLTEEDVRQIREKAKTMTRKAIAKEYNMSVSATNSIVNRSNWKHVQ